jgi:hypothetical protein
MRKIQIIFLTALSFIFISCNNASHVASQMREEIQTIKNVCPQYQGNGVTITDANFYESEKVLEYVYSIENVKSIDASTIAEMKKLLIKELEKEEPVYEILKNYDYRMRYIYTDTEGNELCNIEITKYDL